MENPIAAADLIAQRDRLLGIVAHELRSALLPILGAVHILKAHEPQSTQLSFIDMIDRNARTANRLVMDLIDVSRIENDTFHSELKLTEFWPLVQSGLEPALPLIESKRIDLIVRNTAEPVWIHADPDRIRQVVWNLTINAAKFTPENGHIAIELRRDEDPNRAILVVTNTGQGISADELNHIFEPYWQGDGSSKRDGLGLGLFIVKKIVEGHSGEIKVESVAGQSSAFQLTLPLAANT